MPKMLENTHTHTHKDPPLIPRLGGQLAHLLLWLLAGCWLFVGFFFRSNRLCSLSDMRWAILFNFIRLNRSCDAFWWSLVTSVPSKYGFRIGRSSFLRFSRFFCQMTSSSCFGPLGLGAPFGDLWGTLGLLLDRPEAT